MIDLALFVGSDLEDQRIKNSPDLADGPELLPEIIALIEIIRTLEDFLCFFKSNSGPGVIAEQPAFARIELEPDRV